MKATLQGFKQVDFRSDKGEEVKGTQLFITYVDKTVTGLATNKIFVRHDMKLPDGLKQNDILDLEINMNGKVESISLIKESNSSENTLKNLQKPNQSNQ